MPHYVKIDAKKKQKFIECLSETGSVTKTCEALAVSRVEMYKHRNKDPEFKEQWEAARQVALQALEDEAWRRAFKGTEKPVYYRGAPCGYIREYSDHLMTVLLNANLPEKYRYQAKIEHAGGLDLQIKVNFVKPDNEQREDDGIDRTPDLPYPRHHGD